MYPIFCIDLAAVQNLLQRVGLKIRILLLQEGGKARLLKHSLGAVLVRMILELTFQKSEFLKSRFAYSSFM
ncbi:hypothetical protein COB11_00670 [Candidatus Aerophobetes bacterium]|uniref:Uncharacterized protein n=1 Tax=Aerophobetes bacterium TaxID=2030807 RepID=A0A2A4YMA3_UNCAE|nr:MAG: hypothetical protein COB11_00670 [Candidatus Aerophobetes bacterium]